jgi:hypothetical protein
MPSDGYRGMDRKRSKVICGPQAGVRVIVLSKRRLKLEDE